jgi:hypothetical protein
MNQRPTSITVIAWALIVVNALSLVVNTFTLQRPEAKELMSKSPIPVPVQFAMFYVGSAISIVAGIFMLRGRNWARLLYVIASGLGLIIGFATSPVKTALIPGTLMFAVVCFFLFRPKANEYFRAPAVPVPTSP